MLKKKSQSGSPRIFVGATKGCNVCTMRIVFWEVCGPSGEKHVARLPLMTGCLLPAVLLHCAFHVRLYDPFMARAFITLSHWGGRGGICFGSMFAGLMPCQRAGTVLAGKSIRAGRTDNLLSPTSLCALHTHAHTNAHKEPET